MSAAWGRLRDDRPTLLGIALVALPVLFSLIGPLFTVAPDLVDVGDRLAGPSAQHLFGTDNLGRDMFTRILNGGRTSLLAAIIVTAAITLIGTTVGLVSGYYGGWIDAAIMRIVDVLLALPRLVLALAVTGILGPSLPNLMIAIIVVGWADYSRIVRSLVLGLRERPFVESARAVGADRPRIVLRHIAPNLLGQVIVLSTLDFGAVLLTLSGLSFLGLGVRPPTPEWGSMLAEGKNFIDRAPQLMVYPGAAIAIVVLGFNLLGDGLRDLLDPRVRR
ncbi:MAG: ABC transporter permease [Candidatus Limnocylindrales bacterium]